MADPIPPGDPRVYFAAERTLLAWIRTGIAMMGLGFVVAKFGLFLREIGRVQGIATSRPSGASQWFGTVLIAVGVVTTLCAAANHYRTLRSLDRNEPLRFGPWSLAIVVALLLAFFGALASTYLLSGLEQAG